MSMESTIETSMRARLLARRDQLREIDGALHRIEAGRYGECESCGARIETKRLAAVPYAQRCQNCATAS